MRTNLLLRRDALTVDIVRAQQIVQLIESLIRTSGEVMRPETLTRVREARLVLNDTFHELLVRKEEMTRELTFVPSRSGILPPPNGNTDEDAETPISARYHRR